jgi:hypothetical protein
MFIGGYNNCTEIHRVSPSATEKLTLCNSVICFSPDAPFQAHHSLNFVRWALVTTKRS